MEDWPVFLCYRQVDGKSTAEWLYKRLHSERIPTEGNDGPRLDFYFDQTAPAVGDWTQVHRPALQRARAMLVVCTPGLHSRFQGDDWVHRELDWWLEHRQTAPILIDSTGEGDRWVPGTIQRRWPKAQRIEFKLAEWEHCADETRTAIAQRVVSRIIEGIRRSEEKTTHEDLERFKRLTRALAVSLVLALGFLAVAGIQWNRASNARDTERQRAAELEVVTDFQSSMLGETDAEGMGLAIVDGFEDRIRAALAERIEDQEELDRVMHDWRQQTLKAGPTTVALEVLNEFVLAKAAATIEIDFAGQPLVRAALQQAVADTYREIGLYEPALPLQEAALESRRRVLGDDHADTLTSINGMGSLLVTMGEFPEARAYYREALEGFRRVVGDDHLGTLVSINNMGFVLESMGKYEEALRYSREALDATRRVLGDDHPETLRAIGNLALVLVSTDRLAEAESYYGEALERNRRVLGDDHRRTLGSIVSMGMVLVSMGRHEEASRYSREGLDAQRRILGDDHPQTLTAINNMGFLLHSIGKLAEAEIYFREALARRRRVLGNDHAKTLISINNMGMVFNSMGKLEEAEPYFREGLERSRLALGDDHPLTLTAINNLGLQLKRMNKLPEAEPYYREALEGRRRILGNDHLSTLVSVHNMGNLLRNLGHLEEADALGAEAVRRTRATLAPSHPFRLAALAHHGRTLGAMQRFTEAEAELLEAYESYVELRGFDERGTKAAAQGLVDLYAAWHESEPDEGYDAQAADWRAKLPAPARAGSLIKLGMRLLEDGRHAEAEAPLRECLEIRQEVLADGHWLIFNTMSVLGESLAGQGADPSLAVAVRIEKLREAEPLLLEGYEGMKDHSEAPDERRRQALERIVKLYEAWHAAEPDPPEADYDAKAAEWRSRLPDDDPE